VRAFDVVALACTLLLLLLMGAWLHAARSPGTHLQGTACSTCHLAGHDTTRDNARLLTTSQEKLCERCHPGALQVSHPSGFNPGRPLPAQYPVDWKGDLTCSSCHDVHDDANLRLRGTARGKAFCLACHPRAFFDKMRDGGISTVQSGHAGGAGSMPPQGLDPFSLQCLGCHGQQGDGDSSLIDRNLVLRHARGNMNHPIARNYAAASRFGGFRSPSQLSRKILLPAGQLSCVSCHLGYSKEHGKLVMQNQRSALCLECHEI
jgi:predicted CXXCH cytochrome family protein